METLSDPQASQAPLLEPLWGRRCYSQLRLQVWNRNSQRRGGRDRGGAELGLNRRMAGSPWNWIIWASLHIGGDEHQLDIRLLDHRNKFGAICDVILLYFTLIF